MTKISALPAITSLLATDEFAVARTGTSKKIAASNLAGFPWNQQFSCGLGFTQVTGTWTLAINTLFAGLCSVSNDGNNSGEVSWPVSLDAGTYTFVVIGQTTTNRAIQSFRLNGTQFDSWDAYAVSGNNNAVHTATGIAVASSGTYTFSILANGKNGSSSSYFIVDHLFAWVRTA